VRPNNEMLPLQLLKAENGGFIPTDNETRTAVPGVFAAGDIRNGSIRQVIAAAGDGAVAAVSAGRYLHG